MTETERIANAVYDRHMRPELHYCHTSGCQNLVAGDDYCARCSEEMDDQPCTLAEIINEMPKWWARMPLWIAVYAVFFFATLCILRLILRP